MPVIAALMAFLVTVVFLFALRPVAEAWKLLDFPGGRKRHEKAVPLIGGIAMCIGLTFGTVLTGLPAYWPATALAVYLLVIVGTIDDRFDLPAGVRLIAQTCAALLVVFGGDVVVTDLGSPVFTHVPLGHFSELFTVLFLVTLINAFNVVDGIDGLAGGLAFVALAAIAFVGIGTEVFPLALVLTGSVAGFLLFNLPIRLNRAVHAFMGDAGSTFLGLAIATVGIAMSQGATASLSPPIGLWFIAVPAFDLFSAAVRRILHGRSPFVPDHEHLHHLLTVGGLSRTETLGVMLALAGMFALVGLIGHEMDAADGTMVLLWLGSNVLYYQAVRRPGIIIRSVRAVRLGLANNRVGPL